MERIIKQHFNKYFQKNSKGSADNVLYDSFSLCKEIQTLNNEVNLREKRKLLCIYIISFICFIPSLVLYLTLSRYNCISGLTKGVLIFLAVFGIALFIFVVRIFRSKYYESIFTKSSNLRSKSIEYMIRYYLINKSTLKAKSIKYTPYNRIVTQIKELNEKSNSDCYCATDISILIYTIEKELKSLEEKRQRRIIIVFLVTIVTTVIGLIKDLYSFFYWHYFVFNSTEVVKVKVTSGASILAVFIFAIILICMASAKDSKDITRNKKIRNLEYAIYTLKKIQSEIKQ